MQLGLSLWTMTCFTFCLHTPPTALMWLKCRLLQSTALLCSWSIAIFIHSPPFLRLKKYFDNYCQAVSWPGDACSLVIQQQINKKRFPYVEIVFGSSSLELMTVKVTWRQVKEALIRLKREYTIWNADYTDGQKHCSDSDKFWKIPMARRLLVDTCTV